MTTIGTIIGLPYLGAGWVNATDEDGDVVIRLRGFSYQEHEAGPPIDPAAAIIMKLTDARPTTTPPMRGRLADVSPLPESHPDCARCNAVGRGEDHDQPPT